jgi:hypothetical protein
MRVGERYRSAAEAVRGFQRAQRVRIQKKLLE